MRPERCNQRCGRNVRPFAEREAAARRLTDGLALVSSAAEPTLRARLMSLGFECSGACQACALQMVTAVELSPAGFLLSLSKVRHV